MSPLNEVNDVGFEYSLVNFRHYMSPLNEEYDVGFQYLSAQFSHPYQAGVLYRYKIRKM